MRRSLAPRPAGARQTSRSGCPRSRLGSLANSHARGAAGRAGPGARGRPAGEGAGWSRPPRGPAASAPGAGLPRAGATPEPLSGSALRPPGPAAPPARPPPSVHARGRVLPRARTFRPGTLLALRPTGPRSPRSPGRRSRERVAASERAREPAPDVPGEFGAARSARSLPSSLRAAAAAVLKGPVLSLRADPGGGRGRYLGQKLLVAGACGGARQAALLLFSEGGNLPQRAPVTPVLAFEERV